MKRENTRTDLPLLSGGEADEPDDAGMRFAVHDGQLTEVLVERHEHAPLRMRLPQEFEIARISSQITSPAHIMSFASQGRPGTAPDAAVQQELQTPAPAGKSSMRSCATSRCAYERHAWTSSRSSQG